MAAILIVSAQDLNTYYNIFKHEYMYSYKTTKYKINIQANLKNYKFKGYPFMFVTIPTQISVTYPSLKNIHLTYI